MWIDTHCHLASKEFEADLQEVFTRAKENGVEGFIVIGAEALSLADQNPSIWVAVGIHPHDAAKASQGYLDELKKFAAHKKVVAIGEIGLDYHYDHSPRDVQQKVFAEQLQLAKELNLPVSIHSREAWDDTIRIIKEAGELPKGGVFHCFGGNLQEAHQAIDLGFTLSISGIVTFKKAQTLLEVVEKITLEKIVIETDAPFLAPVPYRGKRNEPAFVKLVGEKIAEIRKMAVEEVSRIIKNNTNNLFHLSLRGTK